MISAINLRPPRGEIHNFRFQPSPSPTLFRNRMPRQITYCRKKLSDADLAFDLATEVAKINTNLIQREEAMKKSRAFLFTELCEFLGLKSEETKRKWKKMEEEAKLRLVKEFVSEWGFNFQPLSVQILMGSCHVLLEAVRYCNGISVLNKGDYVRPIDKALISLIPKVKKPKHMSEFRRATLITNNATMGFKCIHDINNKKVGEYALQVYERAFRQKIDIDKSECLVNKNVRSQLADETCELLGVRK
ncbi:uncharacterized protein E5676_scaffold655G00190 [Cucumis melo var. makuwa]|uniref:DUF7026 domain-containing protein n=1 Tax=Cucumis melo var. makuwa TaxID=1194695 RepID=A0A5D3DZX1_CUCMM|nr:uncharacterized protein E5676_scaffold655G00190 [Cucumis melo var. makuwa]